jgi:hypothetical protein
MDLFKVKHHTIPISSQNRAHLSVPLGSPPTPAQPAHLSVRHENPHFSSWCVGPSKLGPTHHWPSGKFVNVIRPPTAGAQRGYAMWNPPNPTQPLILPLPSRSLLSSAASETVAASAAGASSTTPRPGPPHNSARRPGRVRNPSSISSSRSRISPSHSRSVATLDRCLASRTDASRTRRPSIYHWRAAQHWRQEWQRGADGQRLVWHRGPARHRWPTRRRSTDGRRSGTPPTRRWLLPQDLHHANNTTTDNKFVLLPHAPSMWNSVVHLGFRHGTFMYGSCVNWIWKQLQELLFVCCHMQ